MMSNYGRDKFELWASILRTHWDYLEQEDNYEKIVRRKKLEGSCSCIFFDYMLYKPGNLF